MCFFRLSTGCGHIIVQTDQKPQPTCNYVRAKRHPHTDYILCAVSWNTAPVCYNSLCDSTASVLDYCTVTVATLCLEVCAVMSCPSVCVSHLDIVLKRLNLGRWSLTTGLF